MEKKIIELGKCEFCEAKATHYIRIIENQLFGQRVTVGFVCSGCSKKKNIYGMILDAEKFQHKKKKLKVL